METFAPVIASLAVQNTIDRMKELTCYNLLSPKHEAVLCGEQEAPQKCLHMRIAR